MSILAITAIAARDPIADGIDRITHRPAVHAKMHRPAHATLLSPTEAEISTPRSDGRLSCKARDNTSTIVCEPPVWVVGGTLWAYPHMFRGSKFPPDLKDDIKLSCAPDPRDGVADCISG